MALLGPWSNFKNRLQQAVTFFEFKIYKNGLALARIPK
jgi:hypothetical protein